MSMGQYFFNVKKTKWFAYLKIGIPEVLKHLHLKIVNLGQKHVKWIQNDEIWPSTQTKENNYTSIVKKQQYLEIFGICDENRFFMVRTKSLKCIR